MSDTSKIGKLMSTRRDPREVQDWIFSLTPIGVAFAFYVIFIMQAGIEPKSLFIAFGATAGLIGLQSFWVIRGWRNNHGSTVLLGVIGIVLTLWGLNLYISYS
jgi:hypothetical protein